MYKILLADDFAVFRKQIKRMKLWEKETEFEICSEASDGDEALKMLRADSFDVLLTDIKMPKMTGIELLQAVKDEGLCGCVVLLSEYTDFEYARQGLIMGAFDYIVKPMDEEKLASMLARCRGFLQTRTDTEYPEFEERAVIGALTGAGELDAKLKLFTDAVYKISSGNAMKAGEIFLRAAKSIYAAAEEQFPWIGYVLGDITIFEESIVRYEEFPMMSAAFEKYMRGIYLAAAKYALGKSELVKRACAYVMEHSSEKLTLGDAARECFSNKTYLSHVFKVETGMSFVDYVSMVKCERAKKMIRETDLKIFEIADRLGYEDSEYFSRSFKSGVGMSPSEYKRTHGGK